MPRGLRNIRLSFDAGGITRYGGLVIFQPFCKSLGLRRFLQKQVDWPSHTERKFHPADLFLAHLFAIVAGIGRIENTKVLKLVPLPFSARPTKVPAVTGDPSPPPNPVGNPPVSLRAWASSARAKRLPPASGTPPSACVRWSLPSATGDSKGPQRRP